MNAFGYVSFSRWKGGGGGGGGGGVRKRNDSIYIPSLHSCQSAIRIHIQKNSESDQQSKAVNVTWWINLANQTDEAIKLVNRRDETK